MWISVTRTSGNGWALWVSRRHAKYFPSVLQKFDGADNLPSEFWHAGEITDVAEGPVGGRESVVIGGVNNEFRLPFVARFDAGTSKGVGPAASAEYRCDTRGDDASLPIAYVLLPDSELAARMVGMRSAEGLQLDTQWVNVDILQYGLDEVSPPILASTSYDLDPDLIPIKAEFSSQYEFVWGYLLRHGVVHRPIDQSQRAALRKVLVWNGSAFQAAGAGPKLAAKARE